MDSLKVPKLISIVSFISLLIAIFLLYSSVRNLQLSINSDEIKFIWAYLYVVLVALLAATIFVVGYRVIILYSQELQTIDKEIDVITTKEETALTEDVELTTDIKEKEIDFSFILENILSKIEDSEDAERFAENLIRSIASEIDVVVGLLFLKRKSEDIFDIMGKYAYFADQDPDSFAVGETLSGQVAKNKLVLHIQNLPDNYVNVVSGLGNSQPKSLIIVPFIHEEQTIAVLEIGSFVKFEEHHKKMFSELSNKMADRFTNFIK